MNNQNEDTESRNIPLNPKGTDQTKVFQARGQYPEDRGTEITSSSGAKKRTSNIFFGYNKEGIILENGVYLSWTEVAAALIEYTSKLGENEYLAVRKTGKKVSPERMVDDVKQIVLDTHSHLAYEEHERLRNNQEAATLEIYQPGEDSPSKTSLVMLGDGRVQLPNGEYLPLEAIQEALFKYAIIKKGEKEEEEKNEQYKVLYRKKQLLSAVVAVVAIATLLGAMIGTGIDERLREHYVETLGYNVQTVQVVESTPSIDDSRYYIAENYSTGDKIMVPDGITYYESSDHEYGGKNNQGTIHEGGIREAGEYTINYISVLYNGFIQRFVFEPGTNIEEVLEKESKRLWCSIDELQPMLHIGNEVCGWVPLDDLVEHYMEDGYIPPVFVEESVSLEGEVSFSEVITIDNGTGAKVQLRIVDQDGNLLPPGTEVIGSDGCKYVINELEKGQRTDVEFTSEEVVTFSIKNISPEEALAIAALGAAAILARRKEYVESPMSKEEIKGIVEDFEESRKSFDSSSKAQSLIGKIKEREREENARRFGAMGEDKLKEGIKTGRVPIRDVMEASGKNVPKTARGFEDTRYATSNPNEETKKAGGKK